MNITKVAIVDYPGYYAQSNGDIYSEISGKVLSKWVDNVGYYQVILYRDKKRCYKRIHRLIATAFLEQPEGCNQVNHKNGDKTKNTIENLEWVDNKTNTQHGYDNNMYLSTKHVNVVSTHKVSNQVTEFKSIRECADKLGINRKTLSSILKDNKTNNYDYTFTMLH